MKEFYVRNARVWVKVSRKSDKSFVFALGYTGNVEAFAVTKYSKEFMPTIADATAMANTKAGDYV